MDVSQVQMARLHLKQLEDKAQWEQDRSKAGAALQEACSGSDLSVLQAWITYSESLGVSSSSLRLARRQVRELQEKAIKDQQRDQGSAALFQAMDSRDCDALRLALSHAQALGTPARQLDSGRRSLELLEEEVRRVETVEEAKTALWQAMASRNPSLLRLTLQRAMREGVPASELKLGRHRLQELEEELSSGEQKRKPMVQVHTAAI